MGGFFYHGKSLEKGGEYRKQVFSCSGSKWICCSLDLVLQATFLSSLLFVILFSSPYYSSWDRNSAGRSELNDKEVVDYSSENSDALLGACFWLSGSWGTLVRVPHGCTPHPRFESFAFSCPRNMRAHRLVMEMELMPLLTIHKVYCLTCDVSSSTDTTLEGMFRPRNNGRKPLMGKKVQVIEVTLPGPSISCRSYEPYHEDESGFKINGLNSSACLVRFDILASIDRRSDNAGSVPPICFAAIGDWGFPGKYQSLVIRQLKRMIREHWVKFIVSTGDNFYPRGVFSSSDPEWVRTFENPFSDDDFHRLPFLVSVGNHDLVGRISAQVDYGRKNARWYLPASSYGVHIPLIRRCEKRGKRDPAKLGGNKNTRSLLPLSQSCPAELLDIFVMSSYERKKQKNQILSGNAFFASSQKGNDHRWRLVVNHEALLSGGVHGLLHENMLLRMFLLPFLAKNRIHLYLNGDDHFFEVHHFNGTDFITSGAGGGTDPYTSMARLPTTVWRPEKTPGLKGNGGTHVLGSTLHCIFPFANKLKTTFFNISKELIEEVYKHTTHYKRGN